MTVVCGTQTARKVSRLRHRRTAAQPCVNGDRLS